jgi:hypothetical protein
MNRGFASVAGQRGAATNAITNSNTNYGGSVYGYGYGRSGYGGYGYNPYGYRGYGYFPSGYGYGNYGGQIPYWLLLQMFQQGYLAGSMANQANASNTLMNPVYNMGYPVNPGLAAPNPAVVPGGPF